MALSYFSTSTTGGLLGTRNGTPSEFAVGVRHQFDMVWPLAAVALAPQEVRDVSHWARGVQLLAVRIYRSRRPVRHKPNPVPASNVANISTEPTFSDKGMAVLRCGPAETVHYDHEGAVRAMREAGLAEGYADALLSGSWLSGDVLLEAEREQRRDPGSVGWA